MTDIKALLDSCELMAGYRIDELAGMEPGVFCQGVVGRKADILGNVRAVKRYLLKKRCCRGDSWAELLTHWLLQRGITVSGGRLITPVTDGTGVYEVVVEYVEN